MIDEIIAKIKEEIVSNLQYGLSVPSSVTWRGSDTVIADVDSITDFKFRVGGEEPPVHTVEQGFPQSPIKTKPRKNVQGYTRRTKNGTQRVSGYTTQPKKPDRKRALEESIAWEAELAMREATDEDTEAAIELGIDNAIDSFGR